MSAAIDMIGRRYGRLVVVREAPRIVMVSGYTIRCFGVRCDCGTRKTVRGYLLRIGSGCLRRELVARKNTKHGNAQRGMLTAEYNTWSDMIKRCENPRYKQFEDYGGRGIRVCARCKSFRAFLADMGRKPSSKHSIDRIKNDQGYKPSNCQWATPKQQALNKRRRRWRFRPQPGAS